MLPTTHLDVEDPLTLDDYRSLMGVVADVTRAGSLADLGDRLDDAVARHFGWVGAFDLTSRGVHPADGRKVCSRRRAVGRHLGLLLRPWCTALSESYAAPDLCPSTGRERDVVRLVAGGLTNRQAPRA